MLCFRTPLVKPDLWWAWVGDHPGLSGPRTRCAFLYEEICISILLVQTLDERGESGFGKRQRSLPPPAASQPPRIVVEVSDLVALIVELAEYRLGVEAGLAEARSG